MSAQARHARNSQQQDDILDVTVHPQWTPSPLPLDLTLTDTTTLYNMHGTMDSRGRRRAETKLCCGAEFLREDTLPVHNGSCENHRPALLLEQHQVWHGSLWRPCVLTTMVEDSCIALTKNKFVNILVTVGRGWVFCVTACAAKPTSRRCKFASIACHKDHNPDICHECGTQMSVSFSFERSRFYIVCSANEMSQMEYGPLTVWSQRVFSG